MTELTKTILILGGYGATGRPLAQLLLQHSQALLILAGRSLEKAQALADSLNARYPGARVSARQADAAARESMLAALQGVDLMVVAAPVTAHTALISQAALDSGADYLDVELDTGKLAVLNEFAPQIEQAERCFITEAGFHPGLPAAMVRFAAAQLDRIDTALTAGYLNMGQSLPYTDAVDELMQMFREYKAQVYRNGVWTKAGSFEMRKVDFGGQIGTRSCYSMFFEELRPLPALYPSLREVGFYISESHWMVDWVIYPLVFLGIKVLPLRAQRPLGRLVWWGMRNFSRPPQMVLLRVEATGEKGGRPARVQASIAHPDGYMLTAIPVAACLLQYLDGSANRPGLWMMGHLADPERLFADMERMGAEVAVSCQESDIR